MKRVKSACILQTLLFEQKPELALSRAEALKLNQEEIERYEANMKRARTRYQILDKTELENGSVLMHVRKQYNDKTDVSEYFE